MEEQTLLIGYDLENEFTQINCIPNKTGEPESVGIPDNDKFLIPTVLCYRESTKEWLFGEEALLCRERKAGIFIDNLIKRLEKKEELSINQMKVKAEELLEKFLRRTLIAVQQKYKNQKILKLVITSKSLTFSLKEQLKQILEHLGLMEDRAVFLDDSECFMYYSLSQKIELWQNDVGLFDYNTAGLKYFHLTIGRKTIPAIVTIQQIDLTKEFPYTLLQQENLEQFTDSFKEITEQILQQRVVSTLYFTGTGFEGNWVIEILKKLCAGRRVFRGQNLYTRGACYAARAIVNGGLENILFISDNKITADVTMKVYQNTQETNLMIVEPGMEWKEIKKEFRVILEETNELEFEINNIIKQEPIQEVICLKGLTNRENKTIQLLVQISFLDRDTMVVYIKDIGFGSFYKTSYRVWERVLTL